MELWDIYDKDKKRTGRTMKRNDWILQDGEYHLTVLGVVCRPDGKYLITKRVMTKAWAPGHWEVSGGAAQAGEESLEAAIREVKEETGLDFKIIKFGGITENFFTNIRNQKTHGIDFYYFVKLNDDSETIDKLNMNYVENEKNGKIEHHYSWIPLNDIKNYNILPNIIKNNLSLENEIFHYIVNE